MSKSDVIVDERNICFYLDFDPLDQQKPQNLKLIAIDK